MVRILLLGTAMGLVTPWIATAGERVPAVAPALGDGGLIVFGVALVSAGAAFIGRR
ncbi:MAG: hypothetical protein HY270_00455 [Deltaproteobacteria bacterium]|nr:hypothetical protein [Deltaproteobacteria bacterium]